MVNFSVYDRTAQNRKPADMPTRLGGDGEYGTQVNHTTDEECPLFKVIVLCSTNMDIYF